MIHLLHESRINSNTDFYNISERYTPTEHIFWKWCRKLNLIDFEPAVHKVDWDKNLSDFDNTNNSTVTNVDYFRKYLWKEREVINYKVASVFEVDDKPKFTINEIAKFKVGDKVILSTDNISDQTTLSGGTGSDAIIAGATYIISKINFPDYRFY